METRDLVFSQRCFVVPSGELNMAVWKISMLHNKQIWKWSVFEHYISLPQPNQATLRVCLKMMQAQIHSLPGSMFQWILKVP